MAKAFTHWPEISSQLHELFECAPQEAVVDAEAALACTALNAIEDGNYPEEIVRKVKERAEGIIVACAERDGERIATTLAEPRRLLMRLDDFIVSFDRPVRQDVLPEMVTRVRAFLDDCRRFDHALSEIPILLWEQTKGDTVPHVG